MDVIIDAYNVIFQITELGANTRKNDIEVLRNKLLSILAQYKSSRKHKLTVVFDGKEDNDFYGHKTNISGIEVIFSRSGLDADEEIKRMVSNSSHPRQIIVVTSDREIEQFVKKYGCKIKGPVEFFKDVKMKISQSKSREHKSKKLDDGDESEPISKYTGPSKAEAQYWLKVFKEQMGEL